LANEIGGNHGNPSANMDILISLLYTKRNVGVICKGIKSFPQDRKFRSIPKLTFCYSFKDWPPSNKEKEQIISKVKTLNIKLVISNDFAFHNFFEFIIKPNLKQNNKITLSILTQTQPSNYSFHLSREELRSRFLAYDHFITVSNIVLQEWKEFGLDLTIENSHVISNCCFEENAEKLIKTPKDSLRDLLGISKESIVCVCVASLQTRKNQYLILRNIKKIIEWRKDFLIYFVGPKFDSKGGNEVLKMITESPFKEHIRWIDEVDDAMPYIRSSDIMILPSLGEVMPLSIIEAFALKTVVMASKVGGIPELIEHNKNGILFSPREDREFVKSLKSLISDKNLREKLSKNARITFNNKFCRDIHMNSWKDLTDKLLKHRKH
jgi:glycosyltransferase involved in cell wall biosynthesis